jgi:hypothetical protein
VRFLPSEVQIASIFTKGIGSARFANLRTKLTMHSAPLRLRGDVRIADTQSLDESSCVNNRETVVNLL